MCPVPIPSLNIDFDYSLATVARLNITYRKYTPFTVSKKILFALNYLQLEYSPASFWSSS
jgi:hypothetical protein